LETWSVKQIDEAICSQRRAGRIRKSMRRLP
jgi:hypothetical protein